MVLFEVIDDAVPDIFALDEFRDRAVELHAVDRIEVVVMPVRNVLLRVDVLPERGVKVSPLKIMRCERIACEHRVHISPFDQRGKRRARIAVKGKGRAHDPDRVSMLALMTQQLVELVIITGKRGLTGTPLPERKRLLQTSLLRKPVRPDKNAVLTGLRASHRHKVPLLQKAKLADDDLSVLKHRHAVHARFLGKLPLPVYLKIFRVDAHRMVAFRRHRVLRSRLKPAIRRLHQTECFKIRCVELFQLKHIILQS